MMRTTTSPILNSANPDKTDHKSGILFHLLIYVTYLLLSLLLTYPLMEEIGNRIAMPSYIHDRPWVHTLWMNLWWLWQIKYTILALHQIPLFTDFIFYPIGIHPLPYLIQCASPSLLFFPLASLFSVVAAGNLLLLLSISLSGYAAFLLGDHLLKDRKAAYITGLAFAFSCPQLANAQGHLLLISVIPLIPFFVLSLVRLREQNKNRNIYFLSLVSILLLFSYWYLLVFVSIFSLIYLLLNPFSRNALYRLLKSMTICSVVFVPIVLLVLLRQDMAFSAPLSQARQWSVDLISFFTPSHGHPLFGGWVQPIRDAFLANPTIQSAYLGYPFLAIAMVGVYRGSWRTLAPWIVGFLLFSLLALGPSLHIQGQSVFYIGNTAFSVPLPFALFHKAPVLNALRDCSMFLIMSTLCLAVLVGYGVKNLLTWVGNRHAVYGVLMTLLLFDSLVIPFPTVKVHIPEVYDAIKEQPGEGTLAEVPMRPGIAKYLFYQTIHKKKLLDVAFGRVVDSYDAYGNTGPLLPILKDPRNLLEPGWQETEPVRESIRWAVRFFDIDAIVVHKDLITPEEWKALSRFLRQTMDIAGILDPEGPAVLFRLHTGPPPSEEKETLIDFGEAPPHHYLMKGWSSAEKWGDDCDFCWSDKRVSDLYFYLSASNSPLKAILRLRPFSYHEAPRQTVRIYLNGVFLDTISLARDQWQTYPVTIPQKAVKSGANHMRFVYGYAEQPSKTIPKSHDNRTLSVAFDTIRLMPLRTDRNSSIISGTQTGSGISFFASCLKMVHSRDHMPRQFDIGASGVTPICRK